MEEEKVLAEFRCEHRTDEDETWASHEIRPADLRLRVLDSNLVTFEFMHGEDVIGSYRLCWNGFNSFVMGFEEWFFQDNPHVMTPSCVDQEQAIRCMVHSDLVVSLTIGEEKPEHVFYANRADVLKIFDDAIRVIADLPDAGCYKLKEEESLSKQVFVKDGEVVREGEMVEPQTIKERFANLSKKGHTVH